MFICNYLSINFIKVFEFSLLIHTQCGSQALILLFYRSLTKEEKKQLKEDERRAREQRRLDQLKEKEMKKREEQKTKNRQKSMKAFKVFMNKKNYMTMILSIMTIQDYKLPDYIQPLFSVEILSNKKASKFHMSVVAGERMSVLLIAHDNLPRGLYLVEKEDGTGEWVG